MGVSCTLKLKGETVLICSTAYTVAKTARNITVRCVFASLNHFVLLSGERYFAIKHSFAYQSQVTEVRIIVASGLVWTVAIVLPLEDFWPTSMQVVAILVVHFISVILLPLLVYCNVSVYMEVRRNEKQIIANQVSLEVKKKLLINKKAFYCTIVVLLTVFLCYFPLNVFVLIMISMKTAIPINARIIVIHFLAMFPVLNSLFNPLIYAVRLRDFRVAFIQLLSRKTIAQAEQLERNIFGPKQNSVSAEDEVLKGNETLNLPC